MNTFYKQILTKIKTRELPRHSIIHRCDSSLAKSPSTTTYDLVVVGGGIVGCATAREMKKRRPDFKIAIVEKENELAKHQTGHNSGVIHAGIYYKPQSIKAKLCVEGLHLSYDYLNKNNIPHKKVGKLIVAQNKSQVAQLNNLHERALQNNCPDIKIVDKDKISSYEGKCKGEKAIWSPWTGIVDWALVCNHFAKDFQQMGGDVFLNFEVTGFAEAEDSSAKIDSHHIRVLSKGKHIKAKHVLTCAGLHSDRLAVMSGCDKSPAIVPFRGEYLLLNKEHSHLVSTNIYPVPNPKLPFLGVHFTPRINGDIWLGPNAVLAFSREGYRWSDINIRDCIDFLKFPGFYKLGLKYTYPGMIEILKSAFYSLAVKDCAKFIPDVKTDMVTRGPAGVRAQALDRDGNLVDDFVFDYGTGEMGKRILHCRNAPSPGATSSLAIAKYISNKLEKDFYS
ncbi:L-2-hydroxyglutarate dehydrogenase, mitochondrial [Trichogramma pretiosum]|uniref:L-2-hydroxyglutarate dehydrogenase, mitochondrial n=1 Tax=Trichogramma pretiosum TaxID=7493 RepID=UPI0006C96B6C|nr:L-2-hydroxyglutarate dehydrogenase, mitochondrial [Trichogramma pretiosum]XP_014234586.1 L-2-hydroxyglutarate dehydrogenase, mitochondrial [Trichogramma pretiosum]XP_014234595.1 L-2-hydroxyglutarate dehydrogenase, mitochondrial [Trichogramma pretiosum]